MEPGQFIYLASIWVLPVLLAATFHEAAHAWMAWRLGDNTAASLGRVSFDPFRHVDPFGTVALPAILLAMHSPFLFGWAKPVPVDVEMLRNPRRDMALVAFAGPAANLALAVLAALLMHLLPLMPEFMQEWAARNLYNLLIFNIVLAVFNLLPIPPLDGGKIAVGLLPRPLGEQPAEAEAYGMFVLVGLLFVLPAVADNMGMNFRFAELFVHAPVNFLIEVVTTLTGVV